MQKANPKSIVTPKVHHLNFGLIRCLFTYSTDAGDIRDNMDEPGGHYAKWNKPDEKNKSAATLTLSCLGREQTPSGHLHAEEGPNSKLNPRSRVNEKGKFLPAASGAAD